MQNWQNKLYQIQESIPVKDIIQRTKGHGKNMVAMTQLVLQVQLLQKEREKNVSVGDNKPSRSRYNIIFYSSKV